MNPPPHHALMNPNAISWSWLSGVSHGGPVVYSEQINIYQQINSNNNNQINSNNDSSTTNVIDSNNNSNNNINVIQSNVIQWTRILFYVVDTLARFFGFFFSVLFFQQRLVTAVMRSGMWAVLNSHTLYGNGMLAYNLFQDVVGNHEEEEGEAGAEEGDGEQNIGWGNHLKRLLKTCWKGFKWLLGTWWKALNRLCNGFLLSSVVLQECVRLLLLLFWVFENIVDKFWNGGTQSHHDQNESALFGYRYRFRPLANWSQEMKQFLLYHPCYHNIAAVACILSCFAKRSYAGTALAFLVFFFAQLSEEQYLLSLNFCKEIAAELPMGMGEIVTGMADSFDPDRFDAGEATKNLLGSQD